MLFSWMNRVRRPNFHRQRVVRPSWRPKLDMLENRTMPAPLGTTPLAEFVAYGAALESADSTGDDMRGNGYVLSVVAKDLKRPHGIAAGVLQRNAVYFTQIPEPGVGGGSNTVTRLTLLDGTLTDLDIGDPEPTHIAQDTAGNLYWTCKSAGVIVKQTPQGEVSVIAMDLQEPTGIAVDPAGTTVYFTEVPTPGVGGGGGGMNRVSRLDVMSGKISRIDGGDPEPTDIAVAANGDLYWTCKSAGVIVRREAATGETSVIVKDLKQPLGIALDHTGTRLYFTEVPTPGINGDNGGSNRVSVYDLTNGIVELIDFGDPEPTDVTVSLSGKIFWTCTSAGVIVMARLKPEGAPGVLVTVPQDSGELVVRQVPTSGTPSTRAYLARPQNEIFDVGLAQSLERPAIFVFTAHAPKMDVSGELFVESLT